MCTVLPCKSNVSLAGHLGQVICLPIPHWLSDGSLNLVWGSNLLLSLIFPPAGPESIRIQTHPVLRLFTNAHSGFLCMEEKHLPFFALHGRETHPVLHLFTNAHSGFSCMVLSCRETIFPHPLIPGLKSIPTWPVTKSIMIWFIIEPNPCQLLLTSPPTDCGYRMS